jgi:cardiolipin synthase
VQVEAIHQADRRVWLVTPYFVPGEAAKMALTSAALRGLDVRVIVPARSDSIVVSAAARSYYDDLLAAGVRVFEYQPRMLHTKALLIDGDTCLVGSANFDHRSFRLNFELSVLLHDEALAGLLEAQLVQDLGHCLEIRQDAVPAPFHRRLGDACARLFSPLL